MCLTPKDGDNFYAILIDLVISLQQTSNYDIIPIQDLRKIRELGLSWYDRVRLGNRTYCGSA